jgi:hypothetical protein
VEVSNSEVDGDRRGSLRPWRCSFGASELGKRELLDVISIAVSKEERPRVSSREISSRF